MTVFNSPFPNTDPPVFSKHNGVWKDALKEPSVPVAAVFNVFS